MFGSRERLCQASRGPRRAARIALRLPIMPPDTKNDHGQVRMALQQINDAWLHGPSEDIAQSLEDCFHDEMVIRGPDFQELSRGKAACAQSYLDFLHQAKIQNCKLEEPEIDIAGDTAIATYGWEMTYELAAQTYTEAGHDLFVFTRREGKWLAAWRALLPSR